ncbi:hypothetical protein TRVA0_023S01266 [Trichomonascus vanleenenianus]|uniref:uncharacterized protein n=1 Tax=Trichomonascus vanleenenianus TaxID=2268995 RepID=UPI003EC99297
MERRPNPPGWKPPKAPYNPYDPTDLRPPEGYPSEYNAPGTPRSWSISPKEPSNYRVVKDTLKRMQYTPRPLSEKYPGQYKILVRTKRNPFEKGVKFSSMFLGTALIFFGVFFYRWNDGYDHVFSLPYRWQLGIRESLFGNLSEQQKEDLEGKQRGFNKVAKTHSTAPDENRYMAPRPEDEHTMQRPMRNHLIEAERIRQEREEAILRAVDIAERELQHQQPDSKKKKFLGIF